MTSDRADPPGDSERVSAQFPGLRRVPLAFETAGKTLRVEEAQSLGPAPEHFGPQAFLLLALAKLLRCARLAFLTFPDFVRVDARTVPPGP
jgi:hypothetical protein